MSKTEQLRWYVVHVYSGSEKHVKETIERLGQKPELQKIRRSYRPTEEVVEMRSGQKRKSERKFFRDTYW